MSASIPELGRICLRQVRTAKPQTRSFSSTTGRRRHGKYLDAIAAQNFKLMRLGPITAFDNISDPELDAHLQKLRENVFLPAHLRIPQKHLIYRKHFRKYLEGEEPVKVELPIVPAGVTSDKHSVEDGPKEEFTLKPLNRLRDEPKHIKSLAQILDLLRKSPENWRVIPSLLREWHLSGRKLRSEHVEKLVRRAGEQHQIGLMLECFKRVDDTHIRLSTFDVAFKMLLGSQLQALDAKFRADQLDEAINHSFKTLELLEDKRHMPITPSDATRDPRRRPELYGVILGLLAMRRLLWKKANRMGPFTSTKQPKEGTAETAASAQKMAANGPQWWKGASSEGTDDLERIKEIANKLLENMPNAQLEFPNKKLRYDYALELWAPAWFGIQVACKVLSKESPERQGLERAFQHDPLVRVVNIADGHHKHNEKGLAANSRALSLYNRYVEVLGKIEQWYPSDTEPSANGKA